MENKEKLTYDLAVSQTLQHIKKKFEQAGLELDTRYIDYFGENCPHCGNAFKMHKREVKDAATVSTFLNMEQQKGIAYCICKKCAKELSKPFAKMDSEGTEERIFEKIPDLKRSHKVTKAEIELERRMLSKIL